VVTCIHSIRLANDLSKSLFVVTCSFGMLASHGSSVRKGLSAGCWGRTGLMGGDGKGSTRLSWRFSSFDLLALLVLGAGLALVAFFLADRLTGSVVAGSVVTS